MQRDRQAKRQLAISLAVTRAADMLARIDRCQDDEMRAYLTERLQKHLAHYGLDFRPDVLDAIDRHGGRGRLSPGQRDKRDAAAARRDWQMPLEF